MPSDPPPLSPEPITKAGQWLVAAGKDGSIRDFDDYPIDLTENALAIEQEARTLARTQLRDELTRALDLIVTSPIQDGPYKDGWADALEAVRDEVALSRLGERE